MKKKLLLISQVFYPDEVSTASLFTDMCSSLVRKGVEVEVWAGHPSYTNLSRQPRRTIYNGILVRYLPSSNFHKGSLAGRFLNILTFTISVFFRLLLSKDSSPVWTHTTPPFTGIAASWICRLRNRKFVYILLDIFPEGLIRLGRVSGKNPFVRLWNRLFFRSLRRSDRIIAIGRDMRDWIVTCDNRLKDKTVYIPHWHDEETIFPVPKEENNLVGVYGPSGRFIVQYSGNMGLWNDMSAIGKAVNNTPENVSFVFVGGGMRKEELTSEFNRPERPEVIMFPFIEKNRFNLSVNAADVHLVSLGEGLEGMAVPCKIYGILAAGKPVIGMVPENSEIAYVIRDEKCGIILKPDDSEGLLKAVEMLRDNKSLCNEMGKNSRKAFENKYKVSIIAAKYIDLLDNLN